MLLALAISPGGCGGGAAGVFPCESGTLNCGGACVDSATDPAHCGGCGVVCAAGERCQLGLCVSGCAAGLITCEGACVDPTTSAAHCGQCGRSCPEGDVCQEGACVAGCSMGFTSCGGGCAELLTDPLNCGDCGQSCAPVEACVSGACVAACATVASALPLGSEAPARASGSTEASDDSHAPSCASGGADESFAFTASAPGHYVFDTRGSGYDTVLVALSPDCTERACNDDGENDSTSRIALDLDAGEVVYLLVDGVEGATGAFTLNANQLSASVACSSSDLGSTVPQTVTGSTAGQPNSAEPDCADPGSPDAVFSFTAPSSREYTFDTFGSDYDTALHLHRGCTGTALGETIACNDDADGTRQSRVSVTLAAGETVVVVVDGFSGGAGVYALSVN